MRAMADCMERCMLAVSVVEVHPQQPHSEDMVIHHYDNKNVSYLNIVQHQSK